MMRQTVLVADDDPSILKLMEMVFTAEGLSVRTASNGQQALDIIAGEPPCAIVLDLRMPLVDGYGVVGRLRSNESTCRIPIIAISAERSTSTIDRSLQVDAFIAKPFELDQLVSVVKRLMVLPWQQLDSPEPT
jgi:CheY-like chemotaxis protein